MPTFPIGAHQNPLFHEKLALKALFFLLFGITTAMAQETILRSPDFRSAPNWEAKANRNPSIAEKTTTQNFGYSHTNNAGGQSSGEIGGRISRSITPATYAIPITPRTLNNNLVASGKFAVTRAEGASGVLIGWFNSTKSLGWRTPHSVVVRLDGNGGKYWVFFEYGTRNWKTGSGHTFEGKRYQTTKTPPEPAGGTIHTWQLIYDPGSNQGHGEMVFIMDGKTYRTSLKPSHKLDGATFDRFGLINQQTAGNDLQNAGYYADDIGTLTMDDHLEASGTVSMIRATADSAVLIGWFNSETHIGAPPINFIGVMIEGPSQIGHYFRPIYANSKDANGVSKQGPIIRTNANRHNWTLEYNPRANSGTGNIILTFDDKTVSLPLKSDAKSDLAVFNRFGLLSYQRGGHYLDIYFDNLTYTAKKTP